ncbi:MAG: helix-turn-helix transcriptional regulator [Oscillospiraceae bacterium]|nr:helix-turn-helix transcriptional regulator [Oscillospiraceae bacterium]
MEIEEIGLRLSKLREEKEVSARDMSLSIGQNAGYINSIETGKSLPSIPVLFYICEYLGITVSEFFDMSTPSPSKLNDLIKDLRKLDNSQLEAVSNLVKQMTKK